MRGSTPKEFGDRLRTHTLINKNYQGLILELLSPMSGKWPALEAVAAEADVAPEEIIAVGDDTNDIEMIRRAGLGIAMGNAARKSSKPPIAWFAATPRAVSWKQSKKRCCSSRSAIPEWDRATPHKLWPKRR